MLTKKNQINHSINDVSVCASNAESHVKGSNPTNKFLQWNNVSSLNLLI